MMSTILCQCDQCHRVYIVDAVYGRMICPACRAQSSQNVVIRLPVEAI